jgi:hypothetical protein
MNPMVTKTRTVRRRRGLDINFASHPWNRYVTAVTARMKAASSGNPRSRANPPANTCPRSRPTIAGTNTTVLRATSELR